MHVPSFPLGIVQLKWVLSSLESSNKSLKQTLKAMTQAFSFAYRASKELNAVFEEIVCNIRLSDLHMRSRRHNLWTLYTNLSQSLTGWANVTRLLEVKKTKSQKAHYFDPMHSLMYSLFIFSFYGQVSGERETGKRHPRKISTLGTRTGCKWALSRWDICSLSLNHQHKSRVNMNVFQQSAFISVQQEIRLSNIRDKK